MNRLIAVIFAALVCLALGAFAQGPGDLNAGSRLSYTGSTGAYAFTWWGAAGNTYLVETSDDLINWSYLPIVESGSNAAIQWGFTSNSSGLFMKLEYITVPARQLTGTGLNGPVDSSSGLPGDWELFYFGQTGINPSAFVPWSNGTITNQQAYQQGLNPIDFYNRTPPNLQALAGTTLSGSFNSISVEVTDANDNPIPGAPVIFSTDYGLLAAPGASSPSQKVEVAADSNGEATVMASPPWWQGISYSVTAEAETAGVAPVTITFSGQTAADDPTEPAIPAPPYPNPNHVNEPGLSVAMSGTSVANPAFEQFEPPTTGTVCWYLDRSENIGQDIPDSGEYYPFSTTVDGTTNLTETANPLFGGITYTGNSQQIWTETLYGTVINLTTYVASEDNYGNWSGSYTNVSTDFPEEDATDSINYDPFGIPSYGLVPVSSTEEVVTGSYAADYYVGGVQLSNQYTDQDFTQAVLGVLASPSTYYDGYSPGDTLAWRELADDSSSFSVGSAKYRFKCATTGSNPYEFEWYEVFQPDDETQPIQITHREWDNANAATASPEFTLDPSTLTTNHVWSIARLDFKTLAQYPECQWRHVVGIGETITLSLVGLPSAMSGTATWSFTSDAGVTGKFSSIHPNNATNNFIVGRTPGDLTIPATFPSNTNCSGGTVTFPNISSNTDRSNLQKGRLYSGVIRVHRCWHFGAVTFQPTNVSFSGLNFQEEKCPAVAGYGFYQYLNLWRDSNRVGTPIEPPDTNTNWAAEFKMTTRPMTSTRQRFLLTPMRARFFTCSLVPAVDSHGGFRSVMGTVGF